MRRAAVAGAGIGGLAAALCLRRAGFAVDVYERAERIEEVGAGLQMSPNASRILVDLGLADDLARVAVSPSTLEVRRMEDGAVLAAAPLSALPGRFGAPYWCLRRADLQRALLDAAARADIAIHTGSAVRGFGDDGGLRVSRFDADGRRVGDLAADVVVGADGIHSALRADAAGTHRPRFTGYVAWRAMPPAAAAPALFRLPVVRLWLRPGRHLVQYPVAAGDAVNVIAVARGPEPKEEDSAAGAPAGFFDGACEALRALEAAVGRWRIWPLRGMAPAPMARGALALVGDAAHPILPFLAQGAALAIEDAAVLAKTLSDGADVPAALSRYDAARRPRAERVRAAALANGRRYHMPWPLSVARDAAIRALGGEGLLRRYDWLYGWRP